MAFAEQLRELMNKKNMKAVELARATGLSEAAISDYLKGKKEPRGRQSIAIAKALEVSLDILWETGLDNDIAPAANGINEKFNLLSNDSKKIVESLIEYLLLLQGNQE